MPTQLKDKEANVCTLHASISIKWEEIFTTLLSYMQTQM